MDVLCDKDGNFVIAGIMQYIEQANVHSGKSYHMLQTESSKKRRDVTE